MLTNDERWILTEAAKPSGFTPHAESVKEFAVSLETRGWLRQSDVHPVWFATETGRGKMAES